MLFASFQWENYHWFLSLCQPCEIMANWGQILSDKHISRKKNCINCLLFILIAAFNGDTEIQNSEIILKKSWLMHQDNKKLYLKAVLQQRHIGGVLGIQRMNTKPFVFLEERSDLSSLIQTSDDWWCLENCTRIGWILRSKFWRGTTMFKN